MVDTETLVRAWRDPEFRSTLDEGDLLPNPAGPRLVEMDEGDMSSVFGGDPTSGFISSISGECSPCEENCWSNLFG